MYYGLVRKPEDQLPGLISAYVQVGGARRRRRAGTGSVRSCVHGRGGSLEDPVGRVKLAGGWYRRR